MPYPMVSNRLVEMCNGKSKESKLRLAIRVAKNISPLNLCSLISHKNIIRIDLDNNKIIYRISDKALFGRELFEKICKIDYGFVPADYFGSYIVTKKQMDKYFKETEAERGLLQAIFK